MESSFEDRIWRHRIGHFILGRRTLLMGILNVTPDSFSDGGEYLQVADAVSRALEMENEGADLIDVGAESTRPGSVPVSAEEQLSRLLPIVRGLRGKLSIPISVDTTLSVVADECLNVGVAMVNDVSGLDQGENLADVVRKHGAGLVVMHMRGTPKTMQNDLEYGDLIGDVREGLQRSVSKAIRAGIEPDHILVDPGIGFGKSFDQNYLLLDALYDFHDLAVGVLAGPSRKGFTGEFNRLPTSQRQFSTAAAVSISILHGADVVRVHDVKEMKQVVDICDRFKQLRKRRFPSDCH